MNKNKYVVQTYLFERKKALHCSIHKKDKNIFSFKENKFIFKNSYIGYSIVF
jgi:hypothetical protein